MNIKLINKEFSKNRLSVYLEFNISHNFHFIPGQFVLINYKWITRAYSIASTLENLKNHKIGFYIKKVSKNWLSKKLVEDIQIWEKIKISSAMWSLIVDYAYDNYLFVSTWTWLAPFIPIIEELQKENKNITLVHWEKNLDYIPSTVIHKLHSFQEKHKIYLALSETNKTHIQDYIPSKIPQNTALYLCGNSNMVKDITNKLSNKVSKVFYEQY